MAETSSLMGPITVALIAAIIGPWLIEYWKWRNEPIRRILHEKEVRYFALLTNLEGFMREGDLTKIATFYEHYRTAWLYVPDKTVIAINGFFKATGYKQQKLSEADKAACNLVWQMRKDFFIDTKLEPGDFFILGPKET